MSTIKTASQLADDHAASIKSFTRKIANMYTCIESFRGFEEEALETISDIISIDDSKANLGLKLRINRIAELRRTMEVGSLLIEADRAMQAAWKQLP